MNIDYLSDTMLIEVTHIIPKIFGSQISGRKYTILSFSTSLLLCLPVYNSGKYLYKIGHVFVCVYIFCWRERCFLPNYWSLKKKNLKLRELISLLIVHYPHWSFQVPSPLLLFPSLPLPVSQSFLPFSPC